ncbi:MAG: AmmeMemoRadiSam system radical SAM enzyme, partial [bacterium]|nr:AmmeMemoRadiSam system radical SAM enzyme [bacterium]
MENIVSVGQFGFCKIRFNDGEKIVCQADGFSSGFAIDPIEKKPLYHFYPTSKALSFGTFGCNMGCRFCQNYNISKIGFDPRKSVKVSPEQIVNSALSY